MADLRDWIASVNATRSKKIDRGPYTLVTRRVSQLTSVKRAARKKGSEYARAGLLANYTALPDDTQAAHKAFSAMNGPDKYKPVFVTEFVKAAITTRNKKRTRVRGTR
jgi:hypothetical protein